MNRRIGGLRAIGRLGKVGIIAMGGLVLSCASTTRIDFHAVTSRADSIAQVEGLCRSTAARSFAYQPPAGQVTTVWAAEEPFFSAQLGSDERVRLVAIDEPGRNGRAIVNAHWRGVDGNGKRFVERRRELLWCDVLIVADGNVVGLIPSGASPSESWIPAGSFDGFESAEQMLGAGAPVFDREAQSSGEAAQDEAIAGWLLYRDAWDFHCNPEVARQLAEDDAAAAAGLARLPKTDCSSPPRAFVER